MTRDDELRRIRSEIHWILDASSVQDFMWTPAQWLRYEALCLKEKALLDE